MAAKPSLVRPIYQQLSATSSHHERAQDFHTDAVMGRHRIFLTLGGQEPGPEDFLAGHRRRGHGPRVLFANMEKRNDNLGQGPTEEVITALDRRRS